MENLKSSEEHLKKVSEIKENSPTNKRASVLSSIKVMSEKRKALPKHIHIKEIKAVLTVKQPLELNEKLRLTLSQAIIEILFETPKEKYELASLKANLFAKDSFEKMKKTLKEKCFLHINQRGLGLVESINALVEKYQKIYATNESVKQILIVFKIIEDSYYLNQKLSIIQEQTSDVSPMKLKGNCLWTRR